MTTDTKHRDTENFLIFCMPNDYSIFSTFPFLALPAFHQYNISAKYSSNLKNFPNTFARKQRSLLNKNIIFAKKNENCEKFDNFETLAKSKSNEGFLCLRHRQVAGRIEPA
jgi:hypothetical protein